MIVQLLVLLPIELLFGSLLVQLLRLLLCEPVRVAVSEAVDVAVYAAVGVDVSAAVKGKVFYGQEPPSGESTTTECVGSIINYLQ